jgi:hypothetical protein
LYTLLSLAAKNYINGSENQNQTLDYRAAQVLAMLKYAIPTNEREVMVDRAIAYNKLIIRFLDRDSRFLEPTQGHVPSWDRFECILQGYRALSEADTSALSATKMWCGNPGEYPLCISMGLP